jgi:hypothetical protein
MMAICVNFIGHGFPHQMIHLHHFEQFFPVLRTSRKKIPKNLTRQSSDKDNLFNKQKSSCVSSGDKI